MNHITRALMITLLSAIVTIPGTAWAEEYTPDDVQVIAVPWIERPLGYDWSERPNNTHVLIEDFGSIVVHDLSQVHTPWLDIEIPGLVPWETYTLTDAASGFTTRAAVVTNGVAIFWNVPAQAGRLEVTDAQGEHVLTVDLEGAAAVLEDVVDEAWEGAPTAHQKNCRRSSDCRPPAKTCGSCGCNYDGPDRCEADQSHQPYKTETFRAPVMEQALLAYTSEVHLRTEQCFEHYVSVDAYISGAKAGASGTAGGTLTYSSKQCGDLTARNGVPIKYTPYRDFTKDWYSDGSVKVYMSGPGSGAFSGTWEYYHPKAGEIRDTNTPDPWGWKFTENNGGAVRFTGGWSGKGHSGAATITSSRAETSIVHIEGRPPDFQNHRYLWGAVSGRPGPGGSAMVPMAWKEY